MATINNVDITSLLFQEGSAPATPASTKWRLYFKSTGLFLIDDAGAETGPLGAAGSSGLAVASTSGSGSADYTTTSTSYADVDGTNLSITTTNAQSGDKLRIDATFEIFMSGAVNGAVTLSVAGSDVGDTLGMAFAGTTVSKPYHIVYHHTMSSGTQITAKLRFKIATTGTLTMYNRSAVIRPRLSVTNLSRGGTL